MSDEKQSYSIYGAALEKADGDEEKAKLLAMDNADWRLSQIRELQEQRERDKAHAVQRIYDTNVWLEGELHRIDPEILRHTYLLDGLYGDMPPAKGKTLHLPEGQISRRVTKPKTEKNEERALRWLRENLLDDMDAFLELRDPKVLWKALREHIVYDADGRAVWEPTGEVMEVPVRYDSYDTGSGEVVSETDMVPVIEQIQPARSYTVQVQPLGGEKESPWEPTDEDIDELFFDKDGEGLDFAIRTCVDEGEDVDDSDDAVPENLFE